MHKKKTHTRELIQELYNKNYIILEKAKYILEHIDDEDRKFLIEKAYETRTRIYGNRVYMRGLIEFTNYCKNYCTYCGINRNNKNAQRYRMNLKEILDCCEEGYRLGFRTFVLQGGEDSYFTDDIMANIIENIKKRYPDVAITLSLGEKSFESYNRYHKAGADRYLLRHETASQELFQRIHLGSSLKSRVECLYNLKKIGYQVGAGFMVGIPGQSKLDLSKDLLFLKELEPEMVGIGPFIPHKDTIYKDEKGGNLEDTITMIALTRLFLPYVLLPATTALGSIDPTGREKGLMAGANVVMPNLSPINIRDKYSLYDGKISTGDEAAECRKSIEDRINSIGFSVDMSRGDNINWRQRDDRS